MKTNIQSLSDGERKDYGSLAKVLGIELSELLSLDFYNENIFDESGEVKQIKYSFSNNNAQSILSKMKRLDNDNTVIVSTDDLNYKY